MRGVYSLCFSLTDGVGPKTYIKLLRYFGSPKDAWEKLDQNNAKDAGMGSVVFGKLDRSRKNLNINSYVEKLKKAKVTVIGYGDKSYPHSLKELEAPPIVLYCKGNLELLSSKNNIGVVGARKITSYGQDVTEKITAGLVNSGMCIVSGLAFGVDAIAHATAVDNNGNTIAVLGCGVDCCTPSENQELYEKILDNNGLIISEYPLGMPPSPGSFPARNRIIAGLSLGVLVTEAAEDSGSLITAQETVKLGRPVFAVPGSINSQMSRGTLKLLKDGAHLVTSAHDILEKLEFIPHAHDKSDLDLSYFSKNEKLILGLIQNEPLSMDEISIKTKIPVFKLLPIITNLEMQGIIRSSSGEIGIS